MALLAMVFNGWFFHGKHNGSGSDVMIQMVE